MTRSRAVLRLVRRSAIAMLVPAIWLGAPPAAVSADERDGAEGRAAELAGIAAWRWPLDGFRLVEAYRQPAHRYGEGHRGIDLEGSGAAEVMAPATGTVAFAGAVAGRGILTIDHGDGLVTTLEPVSTALAPGTEVQRGAIVATLAAGGHVGAGELHFGVRLDGEYINPMLLLGGVPRAVLLPCC